MVGTNGYQLRNGKGQPDKKMKMLKCY